MRNTNKKGSFIYIKISSNQHKNGIINVIKNNSRNI